MKISNKSATTYQRSCAYCGEHELTKEHLIPRGYFDRVGGASKFLGNVKAGDVEKFLSIEPTISDVCRNCNNGVLSDLDNYFLSLFDRYLSSVVVSGQQLSLDLHFDELLRWLLKMGYNIGRARQWHGIQELAACTDYIRFGEPHPTNITALMQATTPGFIPGPTRTQLPPEMLTVNAMRFRELEKNFAFVLHIGIHCYQIYVLFHRSGTTASARRTRIKAFQRMFRGSVLFCRDRPRVKLYPSSTSLWELLNGPLWNAGWGQHVRHYLNKARRQSIPKPHPM